MRPDSLTNTKTKNVFQQQNCTNKQQPPTPRETPEHEHTVIAWMLATTIHNSNTTPHHQDEATTNLHPTTQDHHHAQSIHRTPLPKLYVITNKSSEPRLPKHHLTHHPSEHIQAS